LPQRHDAGQTAEQTAYLRDCRRMWEAASPEERNAVVALTFESLRVRDGRITSVKLAPGRKAWLPLIARFLG
jgi:hypothetical protein